jgi:hypothetical protein
VTAVTDALKKKEIAALAQKALDKHQPRDYRIAVNSDDILKDDEWYQLLVTTPNDVRTFEFYDALAQAEAELQDERHLKILLVPVIGD